MIVLELLIRVLVISIEWIWEHIPEMLMTFLFIFVIFIATIGIISEKETRRIVKEFSEECSQEFTSGMVLKDESNTTHFFCIDEETQSIIFIKTK